MMSNWTKEELMICAAADVIQDHDVALVGIGLPTLAAMVAKQTNAPNLQMIFNPAQLMPCLAICLRAPVIFRCYGPPS